MDNRYSDNKKMDNACTTFVVSTIIALLTLAANILDLQVPIPLLYRWLIFCLLLIISIVSFAMWLTPIIQRSIATQTHRLQTENELNIIHKKTEKHLLADSNIVQYLKIFGARETSNAVNIHEGKFSLRLSKSKDTTYTGTPMVDQAVYWVLDGSNKGDTPITSFTIAIMLSAFTSWEDGSIRIAARIGKGNPCQYTAIKDIHSEKFTGSEDGRLLKFVFPQGIECRHAEPFRFEISMIWMRGSYFHDIEQYFSDPSNYGLSMDKLIVEVSTDMDELIERQYQLFRVEHNSTKMIQTVAPKQNQIQKTITWEIKPQMNSVYVINIEK